MIDKYLIGQKIREFRKRSKISQLDLELEIDASPGSISRIESGDTNPTKETIHKISKILKLSPEELAMLFGIELSKNTTYIENYEEIKVDYNNKNVNPLNIIQNINLNDTIENTLKDLIDKGFIYPAIYLKEKDNELYQLKMGKVSENCFSLAKEILGKEIYEVEYSVTDKTLVTHAILTGQIQFSNDLFELIFPHLGKIYSLQSSCDSQLMIALPLKINSNVIGCITFQSKDKHLSDKQIKLLSEFSDQRANAIYTAEVKEEMDLKIENKYTKRNSPLLNNLRGFLGIKEFWELLKTHRHLQIYTLLFFLLASYWLFDQLFLSTESLIYKAFTHVYFIMAAYAAYMGFKTYKLVGSNNKLSKMVLILTLISTNHTLGQITFSIIHVFSNYETIYPSLSEVFFLTATYLSLWLSFYNFTYIKNKFINFVINIPTILIVSLVGILLFSFMFSMGNNDFNINSRNFSATIFDLAYNIGQTLAVVFSLLGLVILRSNTVSKETSFFLVLYFYTSILLYTADFIFTLEYLTEGVIPGGFSDLFYLMHYTMIGIGHIILLATIQKKMKVLKTISKTFENKEILESVVSKIVN